VKRMSNKGIKNLVDSTIEMLPENEQEIIKALYFENTSLYALSRKLHIPRATLRYRKKKALLHLKSIIKKSKNKFENLL
jgi:DNA-directed RNA polymerase specialized sigma subunit